MKKNEIVEETEKSYDDTGFATVHEELQTSKDDLEQISKWFSSTRIFTGLQEFSFLRVGSK